jgi:endonuclease-3
VTVLMTSQEIERFFEHLAALNPDPKGELYSTNIFTLLIAVVLSAQATDKGVNKATRDLFKVADTPQKMLALGEEGLKRYINTIGLYNAKARNITGLCQRLIHHFGGEVPERREDLESLPGVGRKTANVVLNAAFHEPVIAVDTHIFRVSNRTGLAFGKTPLEVEKQLMKRIPARWLLKAHHWLVLHGRYICKARAPLCSTCPVREECQYPYKTKASL